MTEQTQQFYDSLAASYHLIFADWRASVTRQGGILSGLIGHHLGDSQKRVLDCACGIGTQACGLALNGYSVHGTDLSPQAIEEAKHNAQSFGLEMTFGVADFRELEQHVSGTFDAVICCDNSIAHLHTEDDLARAFRSMAAKVAPGGLLMVSLRDYDKAIQEKPRSTLPAVAEREDGRSIVFQVWDWAEDSKSYMLNHFTVRQNGDGWQTMCNVSHLRAWKRSEVTAALARTNLTGITWHMPESSGYYQPIVMAHNPG